MIGMKIVAIAVAVAVVGGAAAVVLLMPGDDRGWYAWDPTVGEIDYSKISATPRIVDVIEQMYEIAYGTEAPEPLTGAKMNFEPLAVPESGGVSIKSSGSGNGVPDTELILTDAMTSNMRIISYGSGFTDTYAQMFGEDVWDHVVAAGNSTWNSYPENKMQWNETLTTEMSLDPVKLLTFLESECDAAYTYCLVVWGYITNYETIKDAISGGGYGNVEILCVDYYKAIGSFEYLLSVIDALGQLVGVSTGDNKAVTDFQERLMAIDDELSSVDTKRTVYMERPDGTSPGSGTLTQLCFDVLRLDNVNKTTGTYVLGDVHVVSAEPDIILFDMKDTRTMDKRMRVTA